MNALATTGGILADVGARAAALPGSLELLDVRLASLSAAEKTALLTAAAAEGIQTRRWRDQYRKDHGLLTALYPNDPRKMESFFKKPAKRDTEDGEEGGNGNGKT